MRSKSAFLLPAILTALFLAIPANAQSPSYGWVYGESFALYDSSYNTVYGYSRTSSYMGGWYVEADAYLQVPSGSYVYCNYAEDWGSAEADFSYTPYQNGSYTAVGDHYYWTGSPGWWQYDGTSSSAPQLARPIHLTLVDATQLVSGSAVRGGSGTMAIYGEDLSSERGSTSVAIEGISASVTYQSPDNPYQINFSFTIPSNTATGSHAMTVTSYWGSYNTTFQVGDPTPQVNSVSGPWETGGTWNFTVDGQWFGSNPSINISGVGAGGYGVNSASDTQISAWVDLTNSEGGTATVTVTSNGYTGSGFVQAPSGGSQSQASGTAQVSPPACAVPVNFHQVGLGTEQPGGTLHVEYDWASSSGNKAHLSACVFQERVVYPGGSPFSWPAPFPAGTTQNPFIGVNISGAGSMVDDQMVPPGAFRTLLEAQFSASQTYRFYCPCYRDGNWVDVGTPTITRYVNHLPDGYWYQVCKSPLPPLAEVACAKKKLEQ